MYLEDSFARSGGGHDGPWCLACKQPIFDSQPMVRLHFDQDPKGLREQTGPYHRACSKPFDSLAHALNMLGRFGR